jgi:hypothetical protein
LNAASLYSAGSENENAREWSDELSARAPVCSWSYIHV